jgi:YD repeat-containing protein
MITILLAAILIVLMLGGIAHMTRAVKAEGIVTNRKTLGQDIGFAIIVGFFVMMALINVAGAGEQTRVYGPDGRSTGTIVPQGQGSFRYYDAGGRSLGTSTTTANTTTFYDPLGNVTGRTVGPARPTFPGRR